ncbi:MAG: argininosuccinate lyase [Gemmatimonadota bacterium]|nr:MAG: argininosuccinate lyase [Gemmatimonadota bacterium]
MTLWGKERDIDRTMLEFTVGDDYLLDQRLVKYDCLGSIAHAEMLCSIGALTQDESDQLVAGLQTIIELADKGEFPIQPSQEDCHTAIEDWLTRECGEVGKKIHLGRSRNDQVLTALRLYEKDALDKVAERLSGFREALARTIDKHGHVPLPGYTHMRRAMPTTIGTWLGAFHDAAKDDVRLVESARDLIDQSPLGTGAGFGITVFQPDRELTARKLGFARVQENPIYAQMSRGKFEATLLHVLGQIAFDLNRLASDLILFSTREYGFLGLPEEFCTGSSIMPQKQNPDVLELVRAYYHVVVGEELKLRGLIGNLTSGYHRDLQLMKAPVFKAFDVTGKCLAVMTAVIPRVIIDEEACAAAMSDELYATEEAYRLVQQGVPFRDAYRQVARKHRPDPERER